MKILILLGTLFSSALSFSSSESEILKQLSEERENLQEDMEDLKEFILTVRKPFYSLMGVEQGGDSLCSLSISSDKVSTVFQKSTPILKIELNFQTGDIGKVTMDMTWEALEKALMAKNSYLDNNNKELGFSNRNNIFVQIDGKHRQITVDKTEAYAGSKMKKPFFGDAYSVKTTMRWTEKMKISFQEGVLMSVKVNEYDFLSTQNGISTSSSSPQFIRDALEWVFGSRSGRTCLFEYKGIDSRIP